jgi:hypothetical protein
MSLYSRLTISVLIGATICLNNRVIHSRDGTLVLSLKPIPTMTPGEGLLKTPSIATDATFHHTPFSTTTIHESSSLLLSFALVRIIRLTYFQDLFSSQETDAYMNMLV